jgi:hypothetical protein
MECADGVRDMGYERKIQEEKEGSGEEGKALSPFFLYSCYGMKPCCRGL